MRLAEVNILDASTIRIKVALEDAAAMVQAASEEPAKYAHDIVTIFEKMPVFDYTYFCFYAYDSAALFEKQLGMDPRAYTSFSLDAPDSFFYALYGGMAALYPEAKKHTTAAC
jgi:hypothetical protein